MLLAIPLAAPSLFALAGDYLAGEATRLEVTFFQILCVGAPALILAQSGSAFYSGRGRTWVVMLVDTGSTQY